MKSLLIKHTMCVYSYFLPPLTIGNSFFRETNQNLHTYEFMLGQYKKLAKVSPVIQTQNNHPLEEELKRIANSIKSIESREGSITNELYQLKSQMSKKTDTEYNDDTKLNKIAFLEGE